MKKISNDLIVGLFVFLVFLGLGLFTIVLSGMSFFGEGGSTLYVKFERVGGLRRHDSVIVRGMPVGQVKALSLKEDGVLVTLSLVQPVTVREGYQVRAESTSLLGGMQLVLETGEGSPVSCSLASAAPTHLRLDTLSPAFIISISFLRTTFSSRLPFLWAQSAS